MHHHAKGPAEKRGLCRHHELKALNALSKQASASAQKLLVLRSNLHF